MTSRNQNEQTSLHVALRRRTSQEEPVLREYAEASRVAEEKGEGNLRLLDNFLEEV